MLDSTPTDNTPTDGTRTDDFAAEQPAGSTNAPAKKAARKAPAKRPPRKTAAKKAAAADASAAEPAGAESAGAVPEGAPDAGPIAAPIEQAPAGAADQRVVTEPHQAAAEADEAKPKKATRARRAPAKKAAGRVPEPGQSAEDGSQPEQATPETAPVAAPAAEAAEQAAAAPAKAAAKRTPRKRVSKAAAAAAERAAAEATAAGQAVAGQAAAVQQASDQPIESTAEVPAPEALPAAPSLAAPPVLFQPPTEVAPPSRRRRGAKSQPVKPEIPAVEQAPATDQVDFPDEVPDSADIDVDLEPEADIEEDAEASAEAEEADAEVGDGARRRRRRGRRGRGNRSADSAGDSDSDASMADEPEDDTDADETEEDHADEVAEAALSASARRRRRRRRSTGADAGEQVLSDDDPPNTVVHVRDSRASGRDNRGGAADDDGVRGVKGSTRLEAKRQRRRDNRDTGRRRAPILTEAEFLARRESVDRVMAVRQSGDRTQIAVLEDDILVEHYVTRASASSAVGNVYLGRVQNVLPSMEAAFVDIGRGRNGVLYAGEVNWDVAGLEGKARSIENALNAGDLVLVQVTKDPIGHKGARLTSQISLPGRFVAYVPGGGMTGISRKLPDVERSRLKAILKKVVPDEAGVIVRTAAEGASEQDLISDVERLKSEWDSISAKTTKAKQSSDGPSLVHGEPDLAIRVVRDIFNDDFSKLVVAGSGIHRTINDYVRDIAPDLADRISVHTAESDLFRDLRVDEQLAKALDRKVWLPSGGSLVIDRTEAMTVVDVNTGKYTGSGGNLEQTVTRNNLEAAEEIVRQLRLRDIGGIVVIDFIDMVLESNRDLVLRRLTECLGRDRTKHQVAEVTSLGLVQMTRKRVGEGLLEAFSEPCSACNGRGVIVHLDGAEKRSNGSGSGTPGSASAAEEDRPARGRRSRKAKTDPIAAAQVEAADLAAEADKRRAAASAVAAIAAATTNSHSESAAAGAGQGLVGGDGAAPDGRTPNVAAADAPAAERVSEAPAADRMADLPAAAEPTEAGVNGAADTGVNGAVDSAMDSPSPGATPESGGPAQPPRRRRRAASRPAGPPVPVSGTEG